MPVSCTCRGFGGRGSGFARSGRAGRAFFRCFVMLPSFCLPAPARRDAPAQPDQPLRHSLRSVVLDSAEREGQSHALDLALRRSKLRDRQCLKRTVRLPSGERSATSRLMLCALCRSHRCAPKLGSCYASPSTATASPSLVGSLAAGAATAGVPDPSLAMSMR